MNQNSDTPDPLTAEDERLIRRGAPVTLEEMTRRRDAWKAKYDQVAAELADVERARMSAARRLPWLEGKLKWTEERHYQMGVAWDAARRDAARYAREVGALRDALIERDALIQDLERRLERKDTT